MKIWIAEIGEPLPLEADVRLHRYGEFSRYLASNGHDVTWWTSTFSHAPKKNFFNEDTDKEIDDVKIKFLYGKGYRRNVSLARIKHHKEFAQKFKKVVIDIIESGDKPDIILSPIPTIAVARVCSDLCQKFGIKHVVDIRDYWPDEITNLAPKPFRPFAKLFLNKMYTDMEYICKNCTSIMGNSQVSIDYGLKFAKRSQKETDYIFPLGYSSKKYSDQELENELQWYDDLDLPKDALKICFFGTIGRFFNLDLIIETAKKLQSKNIFFILAGSGDKLDHYKNKSEGVDNILFPGWLDAKKIQVIMRKSHIGLAPYVITSDFALPNKVFEYMSGSLPILSSIQKVLPAILDTNKCGVTYSGTSSDELTEILMDLANDQIKLEEMGNNAFKLFNSQYRMDKTFLDAQKHLNSL